MFSPQELSELATAEITDRPDFLIPIHINVMTLMCLIGNLQLATRHPLNTGPSSDAAKEFIALAMKKLKQEGFHHTAAMCELGSDAGFDYDPRIPKKRGRA